MRTSTTPIYETDYSDEYEEVSTIPSSTASSERDIVPLQVIFLKQFGTIYYSNVDRNSFLKVVPSFATVERKGAASSTATNTPTHAATIQPITTTEYIEPEPVNYPPAIKNRVQKIAVTAGMPFSIIVPIDTFFDSEDGTNLKLSLTDKNDHPLSQSSWIQFNPENREIYGL